MTTQEVKRKLTAILSADVKVYSRSWADYSLRQICKGDERIPFLLQMWIWCKRNVPSALPYELHGLKRISQGSRHSWKI